jgi:hypothetical protein
MEINGEDNPNFYFTLLLFFDIWHIPTTAVEMIQQAASSYQSLLFKFWTVWKHTILSPFGYS